jgi:hypothetical protein
VKGSECLGNSMVLRLVADNTAAIRHFQNTPSARRGTEMNERRAKTAERLGRERE